MTPARISPLSAEISCSGACSVDPIRDPTADEELAPQELQIALHAAEGESNREIGAALFLSPRTVEFHLTRVYRKLNIHSRAELIRRFSAGHASRGPGG